MSARLLVARFSHETNSFSPIRTPIEAFGPAGPYWGTEARERLQRSATPMGAFLEVADSLGARVDTPVAAEADPSAPVESGAYDPICAAIVESARAGCDAILLELHGAMIADGAPDGEGALLARVRAAAPGIPLGLSLDMHANVTARMIEGADIVVGYKTYPHVDLFETGLHTARILARALRGQCRPVTRWRQLPLLAHTLAMDSSRGAMQGAIAAAVAAEREPGILAASVFGGFPLADFRDAGMSVVVTADADAGRAQRTADRIAAGIWARKEEFVYRSEPLARSIERARGLAAGAGSGPVLLLDHSDNVYSGGTCDTMDVLQGALDGGLDGIAVGPVCDPQSVARCAAAGEGARVALELGNKVELAAQGIRKRPLALEGRVVRMTDGSVRIDGRGHADIELRMGRSALVDIGPARIIVSERRVEPGSPEIFRSVGVDPRAARFLLLKSRMHCRPAFLPIARGLVECDSDEGGPTSSRLDLFPIRRMRRPLFPFDADPPFEPTGWPAAAPPGAEAGRAP